MVSVNQEIYNQTTLTRDRFEQRMNKYAIWVISLSKGIHGFPRINNLVDLKDWNW